MNCSQRYIGTQNGVVVCINHRTPYSMSGYCYHSYSSVPMSFETLEQLLFYMEDLFNDLEFPFPSTNERSFEPSETQASGKTQTPRYKQPKTREKIMNDEELLMQHGDLGSFIIRVQHRQNSSWQGRLTWVEKDQTVNFRSIWEMVKLMESALNTMGNPETQSPDPAWKETGDTSPSSYE